MSKQTKGSVIEAGGMVGGETAHRLGGGERFEGQQGDAQDGCSGDGNGAP